jgi:inner membrane protein
MQNKSSGSAFFGIKALIITGISLALLIPAAMLSSMVRERQQLSASVKEEIVQGAGGELLLAGPFIIVPVEESVNGYIDGEYYGTVLREVIILTRDLSINGRAVTDERSRGIYTAAVFTGTFDFNAVFDIREEKIAALFNRKNTSYLENSRLCIEVSDPRGLRELPSIVLPDGSAVELSADFTSLGITGTSLAGKMAAVAGQLELDFTVEAGGGGSITMIPVGLGTEVALVGDWPTPSFIGVNAPIEREITDEGFTAKWRQPRGTGKYPEYFISGTQNMHEPEVYSPVTYKTYNGVSSGNGMGVDFFDSIGVYHKTERALKYAILFIVVPFVVILLFEVFTRKRIHPIQYVLVGLTDIVFYALLLSLAEQMHFTVAYVIAAGGVIMVISFYTGAILANFKRGLILVPILMLLYGYLYSALQSQDYALLIGSVGMFVILTVVMVITRNIDWYALGDAFGGKGKKAEEAAEKDKTM